MTSGVIDLRPLLAAKQRAFCKHEYVSVDMDAASLTCDACDVEIDPWLYIRRIATEQDKHAAWRQDVIADVQRRTDDYNATVAAMNQRIQALNDEINRLDARRRELANEVVGGVRVGGRRRRVR